MDLSPGFRVFQRGPTEIQYAVEPNGYLQIMRILTEPAARGQGHASMALSDLLRAADQRAMTVHLTADPIGNDGLSKASLEKFYSARGFRKNAGRRKDFSISSGMIRDPKTATES